MKEQFYTVYMLECEDGSLYTGITTDLPRRFLEHKEGTGARYTRTHKPLRVVYEEPVESRSVALKREAKIKSMHKLQKHELIEGRNNRFE
ncbi:MAG: hypothetical protein RI911_669 [Candidatus Parcubacteria bacterium]|jgi:putative endonuclease